MFETINRLMESMFGTDNSQELDSALGFRLDQGSASRVGEIKEKAGFRTYGELVSTAITVSEKFLKERLKERTFVSLSNDYIYDLESWDKKVWMFGIDFLDKDKEALKKQLGLLERSRKGDADYSVEKLKALAKSDQYEEIMINSIYLLEWIVMEIFEQRVIGAVNEDEVERLDPSDWRISLLFTNIQDLKGYPIRDA